MSSEWYTSVTLQHALLYAFYLFAEIVFTVNDNSSQLRGVGQPLLDELVGLLQRGAHTPTSCDTSIRSVKILLHSFYMDAR